MNVGVRRIELATYDIVRLVAVSPESCVAHDLTGHPCVPRVGELTRILSISDGQYTLEGLHPDGSTRWIGEFSAPDLEFVSRDSLGVRDPTPDNPSVGPVETIAAIAVLAGALGAAWWANIDTAYGVLAAAIVIFGYSRWRKTRGGNFRPPSDRQ